MINSISPIIYAPMPKITQQDVNNMFSQRVYQENIEQIYNAEYALKNLKDPAIGHQYVFNKYSQNNTFKTILKNRFFRYNSNELIEIIRNIEIDKYQSAINYAKAVPGFKHQMTDDIAHIDTTAVLMRLNNVLNNPKLDNETKEYIISHAKDASFCRFKLSMLDNIEPDDIKTIKQIIYPNRDLLPYNT